MNEEYHCFDCGSTGNAAAYCERCYKVMCMGCIKKCENGDLVCLDCLDKDWQPCACPSCVEACRQRPCWPTPDEVRKLIELGYGKRLWLDYWCGERYDNPNRDIHIPAPAITGYENRMASFFPVGQCTFLNAEGLCEIHAVKPMEGRLITCSGATPNDLHRTVAMMWNNPAAQKLADAWYLGRYENATDYE